MNLIEIVNREVDLAITLAEKTFGLVNVREKLPLTVRINKRMSRSFGHVRVNYVTQNGVRTYTKCLLEISGRWLAECPELIDTIRHEVSHYIDVVMNNRPACHDAIWRDIARACGARPRSQAPRPSPDVYRSDVKPQEPTFKYFCPRCAKEFNVEKPENGMSWRHDTCNTFLITEINVRGIARGSFGYVGEMTPEFKALVDSYRPVEETLPAAAVAAVNEPKPVKLGKRLIELGCSCGHVGVYSARVKLTANLIQCPSCSKTGNMKVKS